MNLDAKLIAIVGPNEAGKTTFLKGLKYLSQRAVIPISEQARSVDIDSQHKVVSVTFSLDVADLALVSGVEVEEQPRSMVINLSVDGKLSAIFKPRPVRPLRVLRQVLPIFENAAAKQKHIARIRKNSPSKHSEDFAQDFETDIISMAVLIRDAIDGNLPDVAHLVNTAKKVSSAPNVGEKTSSYFKEALRGIIQWCEQPDPEPIYRKTITPTRPAFLLFEEDDRNLRSSYDFNDDFLRDIPVSLSNLLKMADLDPEKLWTAMRTADIARRETLLSKGNARLEKEFSKNWAQSAVRVSLAVEGYTLRVLIKEGAELISTFDERSAGFRTFACLLAFLKSRSATRQAILLVDEAENHLHIDAQADLVNMFATQSLVSQVIYTTHSPGCLPPDLGNGIRTIIPDGSNTERSIVRNDFWRGGAGYSPLMLAMGAAAAAFTPSRAAVLAEGASDMILLPSLIRAALEVSTLGYQIAPGLSEVSKKLYSQLDFEASKVAYIVDGDTGGEVLFSNLISSGIPASKIVKIRVPGAENLLDEENYRNAVCTLVKENPAGGNDFEFPELPGIFDDSWSKTVEAALAKYGKVRLSKVAIANWLVNNGCALPSPEGSAALKEVHSLLIDALDLTE
ncbi:AAA family ATPase [Actinokineospora spheciospongiae]|uniref:AAA family ATPase n=1 Tax=Actinokineospora spheciospongiae TaxID=909613 RepID=UPI000D71386B|nr:AAA family ATPase [Actinokineospora spheciospongiae]